MQHISAQELEIMEIIWSSSEDFLTARNIEERLYMIDNKRRNLSSLMTVIARLIDKGYLEPVKKFRQSTYFIALIQETEYKAYATKQFIDVIHNGKISSFVAAFLHSEEYTQRDIDELRDMLRETKERENNK